MYTDQTQSIFTLLQFKYIAPLFVLVLYVGCSGPAVTITPVNSYSEECIVGERVISEPNVTTTEDSIHVVLLDQHPDITGLSLPLPIDASIDNQRVRYLFRVDCTGKLVPDLARSWRRSENGWTFDFVGTTITDLVIRTWLDFDRGNALFDSVYSAEPQNLTIVIDDNADHPPLYLGTQPFGITMPLAPELEMSIAATTVDFRDNRDPRDLLDDKVDILITGDRDALEYARAQPDYIVESLPVSVIYVFATTGVPNTGSSMVHPSAPLSLFENAVDQVLNSVQPRQWWHTNCSGDSLRIDTTAPQGLRQIAFVDGDQMSRAFATRLALLPSMTSRDSSETAIFSSQIELFAPGGTTIRTTGLDVTLFLEDLRRGSSAGYVFAIPARSFDACHDAATLHSLAPWLESSNYNLVPLSGAKQSVVMRVGLRAVQDYFGRLIFLDGRTVSQ